MSEYVIRADKNEDFQCTVDAIGSSLQDSIARVILEIDELKIVFDGKILGNKCIIPIKKIPSILEDGVAGKMILEIISEGMYFNPWNSDFVVKSYNKSDNLVNESIQVFVTAKKLKDTVKNVTADKKIIPITIKNKIIENLSKKKPTKKDKLMESAATKLSFELLANDINYKNLMKNKKQFKEILNGFFTKNSTLIKSREQIVKNTLHSLIEEK